MEISAVVRDQCRPYSPHRDDQVGPGGEVPVDRAHSDASLSSDLAHRLVDSSAIVDAALTAGIILIDTADKYGNGESETMVGKAIAGRRDDIVLRQ